jgi:hypothetical protein
MLWLAAALMATTFSMILSRFAVRSGASLGQIVNEPTFRDFCTKAGKWFRGTRELFRRGVFRETLGAEM